MSKFSLSNFKESDMDFEIISPGPGQPELMNEKGILFISRLPDTFGLSEELEERAWSENK